ncbi:MAG TPA: TonB-dependent receptor [Bryobacteraceae bacterium]|nr:TonB-dependent receptor [Bryobacteraceae bacterium]
MINRIYFVCLFLLLLVPFLCAEEAGLVGTVTDPSGAVVAGATIAAQNVATSVQRRVTTDAAGRYTISPLAIGRYTLTAEAPGFRTVTVSDIYLTIGQKGVVDVTMQIGEINEKVTVVDTSPLLQAEQSATGQSVENKKIVDLPLNGRDFVQLVALTPGATVAGTTYETQSSNVLINGQRTTKTTSTIDGVMNVDQLFQGFPISPSIDAIEEFRVQSGNFTADQGMGPSNVSVRLKSGTNSFHGTGYEFLRNNDMDARNFFQPEVSPLRRNQFGGSIGGPIRRDKLFWFAAYEGTRQNSGNDYSITVPSAAQRQGDFSGLPPITDPLTGKPFPNNIIPQNRINDVATFFTPFLPLPNSGTQYVFSPPSTVQADQTSGRVDYYINDRNRLFGSYTFNQRRLFDPDPGPKNGGLVRRGRAQRANINWNRTISPTMMNTLSLGWSRFKNVLTPSILGTNYTVQSGLQGFDETSARFPGFPSISINNYQGIDGFDWDPLINPTDNRQIMNDFSIIHGGHQIRVGTDLRKFMWSSQSATVGRGDISYSGDYTSDGWADFLLGYPIYAFRQYPQSNYNQITYNYAFYGQDDWRVTPNLTLNLGLRYEYDTWPVDTRNQLTIFYPPAGKFVVAQKSGQQPDLAAQPLASLAWNLFGNLMTTADSVHLPNRTLRFPDKNNWAPRLGLAYRPGFLKNTVFRMGYGIYYDLMNGNNYSNITATSIPWIISQGVSNTLPTPTLDNQNLFAPFNAPGAASPSIQPISYNPRSRVPYVQEWNVAIQRQLGHSMSVEIAYVGNKGTKLETNIPFNRPTPGPGDVDPRRPFPSLTEGFEVADIASSIYHSLQAKVERQYSNGLSLIASYTLAKSIDDTSSDFGSGYQDEYNLRLERAVSSFDYRQRLSVGYIYDLPFGKGKRLSPANPVMQYIVSGWEASGIVTLQSGSPFTITSGRDIANTGSGSQRPDRIASGHLDHPTINEWFDTSAFVFNAPYTFGNSGRDILYTDGLSVWDASLLRNFSIREGMRLQLRGEFFNALNHPDFGTPVRSLSSGDFGKVFGTRNAPRIGQVGLKFIF